MYLRKKVLRLSESDASGVLYFAQQFKIAQEVFEEYLEFVGLSLGEHLKKGDYLLPVVHAEADFLAPIRVGDELELGLQIARIGDSSFTLNCCFKSLLNDLIAGTTSIVHVVIDQGTERSISIPPVLRTALEALKPLELEDSVKA